ncbi:hypothetical protein GGI06_002412 [Coemansia sp. S85]|nr:hypothetical protein GGI06_002412 [Coemansia sp. S85]
MTELPTATTEIEYNRIDRYYHVFYEEIFGALVNSLSSNTKNLVVNLDVLELKLRPTMENISTISSLKVNFHKGVDFRAQLVHRCASSLKSLYVILNNANALFYDVEGNTVVYPNVQDLTMVAYMPDSPNERLLVPDAVPFPKLKTLEVFLEYPYGDDVLFRGNSGTLESLTIWADKETVEMLNSSPAFGNKFTSLRKLAIANHDDFGYDALVPKEAMARFLGILVGSVRSLDLVSPISVGRLISAVRPRRSCDNIQVLKIGQVNLTAVSILGLLQELPALAKLTCAIYDLGSELEHVATEEQPDYVVSTYQTAGRQLSILSMSFDMDGDKDKAALCVMLLVLACPRLRQVILERDGFSDLQVAIVEMMHSGPFSKYVSRFDQLLFLPTELKHIPREEGE